MKELLGSLELNRIYQIDALEGLKLIPDESIDLVVTDPPYKLIQGGCTNNAVKLKGATDLQKGKVFNHNEIKFDDWLSEVYRVLKPASHCYVMCNDRNLMELLNACEKAGFKLLNILVWKKSKHSPNRYYLKNAEFIVFLRKGKAKNINNMGTFQILEFDNVKNKTHPTEKPVELLECLITNSSNNGDVVLDVFAGTGSTCIAAIKNKRKFLAFEIEREYVEIANQRLDNIEIHNDLKNINKLYT
ncbi:Modification methylase DpnIIB [[Flavobacterium] thermophilum]|nr:Modification methylase DpnIIB [[Flavobacterium] thermophilum]